MTYFPLDRDILTSSVWAQGSAEAVKVWLYLLLAADPRSGVVDDAAPGVALRCGLSLEATLKALEWLASPDEHSRTKGHEGRRIEALATGGYRVLNYLKRRDKDYSTPRVQSWRERKRNETVKRVSTVTGTTDTDTDKLHSPLPPRAARGGGIEALVGQAARYSASLRMPAYRDARRRFRDWFKAGLTLDQVRERIDAREHLRKAPL